MSAGKISSNCRGCRSAAGTGLTDAAARAISSSLTALERLSISRCAELGVCKMTLPRLFHMLSQDPQDPAVGRTAHEGPIRQLGGRGRAQLQMCECSKFAQPRLLPPLCRRRQRLHQQCRRPRLPAGPTSQLTAMKMTLSAGGRQGVFDSHAAASAAAVRGRQAARRLPGAGGFRPDEVRFLGAFPLAEFRGICAHSRLAVAHEEVQVTCVQVYNELDSQKWRH